jgi:hypothetical protein
MHIVLRAGTAAAPFGAAIAISDFDADGAPDSAIADRTTRNGANYKIEVHLSGGATQTMSFFSTKGALHVAALDLDNDHDPDLVVTPVLSREVVGIWVNDGTGHFTRGRDEPYRSTVPIAQSVPAVSGSSLALLAAIPVRRFHDIGLTRTAFALRLDHALSLKRSEALSPSEGLFSSFLSRGPPSSSC